MAFPGRKRPDMWQGGPRNMNMATETRDAVPSSENMDTGARRDAWRDSGAAPPGGATVAGVRGRTPIRTVAGSPRVPQAPIKTVVGNTARPPVKANVGNPAGPPKKTIVGSTAAPPKRTTPGNLGTGGINPLGMAAADRGPMNTANPQWITRPQPNGGGSGGTGRDVSSVPPPSPGPPNASMDWTRSQNATAILDGGMGPAAKRMGRAFVPRGGTRSRPVRRSQFFGE